jgi:thymidylate synthase
MPVAYFAGKTVDDVMRLAIKGIRARGDLIRPKKGGPKGALELTGVLLEITNPRARLSRTETRGKPYSCLGEMCWYLAGRNDLDFISYYISEYKNYADGDRIFGGYGPRLLNWAGLSQFFNVADLLRKKRDTRQAVVQLFDRHDILAEHNDVPCTCSLQFMLRRDKLHMFTTMRSNDAYKGLPHDVFCFTMLQEIMARTIGADVGTYKHTVGSLHLYKKDVVMAQQFLKEGLQPTIGVAMPKMPSEDPWPSIDVLLKAESEIRVGVKMDDGILDTVSPYWADLIRLLMVFGCKKKRRVGEIRRLRDSMSSKVYYPFIDKVMEDLAQSHRTKTTAKAKSEDTSRPCIRSSRHSRR